MPIPTVPTRTVYRRPLRSPLHAAEALAVTVATQLASARMRAFCIDVCRRYKQRGAHHPGGEQQHGEITAKQPHT